MKELNLAQKDVTVWLVKLPSFFTEQLSTLEGDNVIGNLSLKPATSDSPATISFTPSPFMLVTGIPSQYEVKFTEAKKNIYILKKDSTGRKVEGTVSQECFIKPVMNAEYMQYRRVRAAEQTNPKRCIQLIEEFSAVKRREKMNSVSELEKLSRQRKQMLQNKKRERLAKPEVIDILFKAFEKHPQWTVKDLADFSGQPVAYIQELVSEICVLNKKDHRNTYELKPEYLN
ncbi:General transcription factor IIF subunit 2 [Astathelohania contejeani]|uniref:General transcription factor IIF subunit 2 n=1 Tax=Astathelohania contejeani TaxID=164912 RepID=A0ABQ7HYF9_9MICR|nr:General transcription factor IIF subunit 2 [Thelohania contejeani]